MSRLHLKFSLFLYRIPINRYARANIKLSKRLLYSSLFIIILLPLLIIFPPECQSNNDLKHHVIILIDRSASMLKPKSEEAIKNISKLFEINLTDICFRKGAVLNGRKLVDKNKGDHLSVVSFGLGKLCPDYREFIKPISYMGAYDYRYSDNFEEGYYFFKRLWAIIGNNENKHSDFFQAHWSSISIAIPAAIYHHRNPQKKLKFNRTFIIMLTDDEYNSKSGDPTHEFHYIRKLNSTFKDQKQCFRAVDLAKKQYKRVQSHYFWEEIGIPSKSEKYFLRIFEAIPMTKNFAVESFLKFGENEISFKPEEDFYVDYLTIHPQLFVGDLKTDGKDVENQFSIVNAEYSIVDKSGKRFRDLSPITLTPFRYSHPILIRYKKDIFDQYASKKSDKTDLYLKIKFWAHWNEDAYGVHELHPDGMINQGKLGLNRFLPIRLLKEDAAPDPVPIRRKHGGTVTTAGADFSPIINSVAYAAQHYNSTADDTMNQEFFIGYAEDDVLPGNDENKNSDMKFLIIIVSLVIFSSLLLFLLISITRKSNRRIFLLYLSPGNFSHNA